MARKSRSLPRPDFSPEDFIMYGKSGDRKVAQIEAVIITIGKKETTVQYGLDNGDCIQPKDITNKVIVEKKRAPRMRRHTPVAESVIHAAEQMANNTVAEAQAQPGFLT